MAPSPEDQDKNDEQGALSRTDYTFAFGSAGWLFIYYFGVIKALKELKLDDRVVRVVGTSGGALAGAAGLCCDANIDAVKDFILECAAEARASLGGIFRLRKYTDGAIDRFTRESDVAKICGRVESSMTQLRFPFFQNRRVSHYRDHDHLRQCMLASACVVPLAGIIPVYVDGLGYCIDGFFSDVQILKGLALGGTFFKVHSREGNRGETVVVCPFYSSRADIKPSKYIPPWWAFLPPDPKELQGLYLLGCNDALTWAQCRGKIIPPSARHNLNLDAEVPPEEPPQEAGQPGPAGQSPRGDDSEANSSRQREGWDQWVEVTPTPAAPPPSDDTHWDAGEASPSPPGPSASQQGSSPETPVTASEGLSTPLSRRSLDSAISYFTEGASSFSEGVSSLSKAFTDSLPYSITEHFPSLQIAFPTMADLGESMGISVFKVPTCLSDRWGVGAQAEPAKWPLVGVVYGLTRQWLVAIAAIAVYLELTITASVYGTFAFWSSCNVGNIVPGVPHRKSAKELWGICALYARQGISPRLALRAVPGVGRHVPFKEEKHKRLHDISFMFRLLGFTQGRQSTREDAEGPSGERAHAD